MLKIVSLFKLPINLKMISLRVCLIALVIVFAAIQTVTSIQCFECDHGKTCSSTKRNVTCPGDQNACFTIIGKDKNPYILSCANKEEGNKVCDTGIYVECYVCDFMDLCNSSSFVAPSIFTIAMFAAVVTKMYV